MRKQVKSLSALVQGVSAAIALAAVLAAPSIASAVAIIDFSGQAGGTVTVDGGNAIGDGVSISHVQGTDTPLNSGPQFVVTNGVLLFDTALGLIQVRGAVADAGIFNTNTVLLDGTITSHTITSNVLGITFTATGPDSKHPLLLDFFGLARDTKFAYFGFSLDATTLTPNVYRAVSTDVANTAVPEPASVMLLGSGLAGIGLWGMKRRKNA